MENKNRFYNQDVINFAESKSIHFSGEEYLGEKIIMYNQVHLAVSYKGELENYLGIAKLKLARKALEKGCVMAVDGHYYKDDVHDGSVIFAATGLRSFEEAHKRIPIYKKIKDYQLRIEVFAEEHMTHVSTKNFLERLLFNPEDYHPIRLHMGYQKKPQEDYMSSALLNLAKVAIETNCEFVTEIDYTKHDPKNGNVSIAATGLKRN
jgi:hypothetical protein